MFALTLSSDHRCKLLHMICRMHHFNTSIGPEEAIPTEQITIRSVSFEVFTAVAVKNGDLWDVTPCGYCKNRLFGRRR
jgi:hypothetical protein